MCGLQSTCPDLGWIPDRRDRRGVQNRLHGHASSDGIAEGLSHYTEGAVKDAFRHIVGVQFRNLATVGGSLFGRFGFSDVLTLLLALDCDVELYKGGIMSIQEFAET